MAIECRATKGSRSPSWSISPIMANERQSVSTATRAVSHRARNGDTSVAHSAECEKRHIGGTSECSVEFEKGHIGGTSEWRHMGGRRWCSCIYVYVALCTTISHRPRSILPSVLNRLFLGSRERFWGGHRHHIIADASAADGYFWVSFGRVSWECPERSVRASTIGHGGPKPTETVRIPTVFRRLSKLMWSLLASLGALVNPCFGSSYRSAGAVRGR